MEERFPYERKGERRSLFVADVILDNRGELVQRFGGIRDLCSHPDGEILYESFCSHPEETLAWPEEPMPVRIWSRGSGP